MTQRYRKIKQNDSSKQDTSNTQGVSSLKVYMDVDRYGHTDTYVEIHLPHKPV